MKIDPLTGLPTFTARPQVRVLGGSGPSASGSGISLDTVAPTGKPDGYVSILNDGSGTVYFFSGGHRFTLAGTLADPVAAAIVGANAALSLLGP